MTKINLFTNILFLFIAIIFSAISQYSAAELRKQQCYDEKCSVPVSLARTVMNYDSNDPQVLSFKHNKDVIVYSKEVHPGKDWWGVEIDGRRGYAPQRMLRESKVLQKNLNFTVPLKEDSNNAIRINKNKTQSKIKDQKEKSTTKHSDSPVVTTIAPSTNSVESDTKQSLLSKDHISPTYEVIDGTTIRFDNAELSVEPSSTSPTIHATERITESTDCTKDPNMAIIMSSAILDKATNLLKNSEIEHELPSKSGVMNNIYTSDTQDNGQNNVLSKKEILSILHKDVSQRCTVTAPLKEELSITDTNKHDTHVSKSDAKTENEMKKENLDNITSEGQKDTHSLKVDNKTVVELDVEQHPQQSLSTDKHVSDEHILKVKSKLEVARTNDGDAKDEEKVVYNKATKDVEETIKNDVSNLISRKEIPSTEVTESFENTSFTTEVPLPDASMKEESNETIGVSATSSLTDSSNTSLKYDINDTVLATVPNLSNVTEILTESSKHEVQVEGQESIKEDIENLVNQTVVSDINTTLTTDQKLDVNNNVHNIDVVTDDIVSLNVPTEPSEFFTEEHNESTSHEQVDLLYSSQASVISEQISNINEFPTNRNLLNVKDNIQSNDKLETDSSLTLPEHGNDISNKDKVLHEDISVNEVILSKEEPLQDTLNDVQEEPSDVCMSNCDNISTNIEEEENKEMLDTEDDTESEESFLTSKIQLERNYWETLMYLSVTAITVLIFSLGYYYIENIRRDGQLIAKINKLEKDLLVSTKECMMLDENLKSTKVKLNSIQDESFGSNEMVLSLKADLEASQNAKLELEDQVAMLEKDLESATEAGLELERMLREVLSSNNEVNPLAQSVEDLQTRLNAQQAANESLTNALNIKSQENDALTADLTSVKKRCKELEVELSQVTENLKVQTNLKNNIEQTLTDKVQRLELQLKEISAEKSNLYKELKSKEVEVKDLIDVINQINCNNLDLDKLYDVLHIKAEATQLLEERNELKIRLSEMEGAHDLLEEHMKFVKEEMSVLSDQCKLAEKEKKDAETRLEVLSNFFNEKEAQRQKEEAVWLQKQGEVTSTVERIHTMQNEIQSYKQQIEMLKREIVDQEREYKSQISALETKAHEQWVIARQNERRLEESKVEAGQLRNRLTLIEKNINDADPDVKLHRLEANGETTTSPPLFIGAESSNSPIMFTGSSGVPPPPPPSYMHLFPPYLPLPLPSASGVPPYDVGQRPPPLGGRLSSPPPMQLHPPASGRYDNAGSPPPPMSPHLLPPFNRHRSPPPPPFGNDHIHHPPLPPPPGRILPPPLGPSHSWAEETLSPLRNSGFHPHQREQRARNHKGSLHSSGESLDKSLHGGKV